MKNISSTLLCAALTLVAASQSRAGYVYDWTNGQAGYSGTIVLDNNSDAAGSLSDITSASITTPEGTFAFNPSTVYEDQPDFAWNPSQITNMWIDWTVGGNQAGFGEDWNNSGENFVGSNTGAGEIIDFSGSWLANGVSGNVPDMAPTGLLLGLAVIGLAMIRRRSLA